MTPVPPLKMLRGIHAPNAPVGPAATEAARAGGFQSVKLLYHHTLEDVKAYRAVGVQHFLMRLPNPDDKFVDGQWRKIDFVPSAEAYAEEVARVANDALQWGILELQLGNEWDRLAVWQKFTPPPGQTVPQVAAFFIKETLRLVRARLPKGATVRIGLAPVSCGVDEGQEAWLEAFSKVYEDFDFVVVDTYWQSLRTDPPGSPKPSPMYWWQFGGNAAHVHELMPNRPKKVGEFANSSCTEADAPPQTEIQAAMAVQYPLWLAWAEQQGFIEAVYCFISEGCTPEWAGFVPSRAVLQNIAPSPQDGAVPAGAGAGGNPACAV